MGGLPRRATFFRQLQEESELVYFDLGNNFPKPSEQGNLKVSLIHQSLKEMNPSVILLGPNEWSYGKEFIDLGMPYLLSNGSGQLPYLKGWKTKIGNRTVQVLATFPSLVYQNPNDSPSVFPVDQELLGTMEGNNRRGSLETVVVSRYSGGVRGLSAFRMVRPDRRGKQQR